ncbi:hypothetical protein V2J09_024176 [Rumex salicifolius]
MDWWVVLVIVGSLWLFKTLLFSNYYYYQKKKKKKSDDEGRIPIKGSGGWPFIGETLHFIASGYSCRPVSFMDNRKSLYGEVFKTHLLGKPVIVSTDTEVNKFILVNNGNLFVPCYPKSITDLFGESSILSIDGSLHRRLHSSIARFFKSTDLKDKLATYIEASVKASLASWSDPIRPIYIQDETGQITFEILVKLLMDIDPGEELDFIKREYKEFIKGLICIPINFPGTQLYKSLKAKKRLLVVVRKMVEERKAWMKQTSEEEESRVGAKDAMEMLLREGGYGGDQIVGDSQRLPLDLICCNIVDMMIPGDESVPMVMTLAEENMEMKRQKMGSPTACYHWTDYMSLPFTQHVISETLRLANIVNAVWRKATRDVDIKGYLIPKGTTVMASFTSVHMDEQNYENPYDFDPWRWQKKGPPSNCSHAFTPFGGGQRLCPGAELARLEISIFLHHLVTTYSWVVAKEDEIVYFPTVKMKRKLPICVAALN